MKTNFKIQQGNVIYVTFGSVSGIPYEVKNGTLIEVDFRQKHTYDLDEKLRAIAATTARIEELRRQLRLNRIEGW